MPLTNECRHYVLKTELRLIPLATFVQSIPEARELELTLNLRRVLMSV